MATATTLFLRGSGRPDWGAIDVMSLPPCDKGRLVVALNGLDPVSYGGRFRVRVTQNCSGLNDPGPDNFLVDYTFPVASSSFQMASFELDDLLWQVNTLTVCWEEDPEASGPQSPPSYQPEMWFTYIP